MKGGKGKEEQEEEAKKKRRNERERDERDFGVSLRVRWRRDEKKENILEFLCSAKICRSHGKVDP